jgi:hypothetical protein
VKDIIRRSGIEVRNPKHLRKISIAFTLLFEILLRGLLEFGKWSGKFYTRCPTTRCGSKNGWLLLVWL